MAELNEIQASCTGGITETHLGHVYGVRGWRPRTIKSPDGRFSTVLTGDYRPVRTSYWMWTPGVNRAECRRTRFIPDPAGTVLRHRRGVERGRVEFAPCAGFISPDCACGFYAYHSSHSLYVTDHYAFRIFGVIRGSGLATIGTKGFRCENAEITALYVPPTGIYRTSGRSYSTDKLRNGIQLAYPEVSIYSNFDNMIREELRSRGH